jgi:hypothetical protein
VADLFDEVGATLMQEEGALVDLEDGSRPLDLLEDGVASVSCVDDRVVLVLGAANWDMPSWVGAVARVTVEEAIGVTFEALGAD